MLNATKGRGVLQGPHVNIDVWRLQVPGQSLGSRGTVDLDTFCWLAEALLSANPDLVLRPVQMPKYTRVGRFKAIAKAIAPLQVCVLACLQEVLHIYALKVLGAGSAETQGLLQEGSHSRWRLNDIASWHSLTC